VVDVIRYDIEIDKENIKLFRFYNTSNSNINYYKCVICQKPCCIENSFSNQGKKLVCLGCYAKEFHHNIKDMFDWIEEVN
jgi:hypothetical protein